MTCRLSLIFASSFEGGKQFHSFAKEGAVWIYSTEATNIARKPELLSMLVGLCGLRKSGCPLAQPNISVLTSGKSKSSAIPFEPIY